MSVCLTVSSPEMVVCRVTTPMYGASLVSIMKNATYSIVSWNVRGLGDNDKCSNVFSEINLLRPSIALLQETKLQKPDTNKLRSILPRFLDSNNHLDAIGSAGGILSATNSRFSIVNISVSHLP